jgi:sporulation protein YlmC with PRC-barrel domain
MAMDKTEVTETNVETTASSTPPVTAREDETEAMTKHLSLAEWHGKDLVDRDGDKIGKLKDVYVDVETDEPMFGTVKEGHFGGHLTFVPLGGITIGPDNLQVRVSKEQVKNAPNIEMEGDQLSQRDESTLYHHYQLNYTPPDTQSGRRLARR